MSAERPVTSKSRGICRYYNTSRGCFAGSKCKFLHGESEKLTPYDMSKTCRFFAAGYCRRGDKCWFQHAAPQESPQATSSIVPVIEEEDSLCCICYEKPVTFGLLVGCSHIFCVECIRQWRKPDGKSEDVVCSGVTKQCPLCRASSKFVTPSSRFYPEGHPGKAAAISKYKASMARVPCSHFQRSPPYDRFCPFGKDCFYQHANEDGTPYIFEHGVEHNMTMYRRRMSQGDFDSPILTRSLLRSIYNNMEAALDAIVGRLPELPDDFLEGSGSQSGSESSDELNFFIGEAGMDDGDERTVYQFGTVTPLQTEDDSVAITPDAEPHVLFSASPPEPPSAESPLRSSTFLVNPEAAPFVPQSTVSRRASEPVLRFSTVVPRSINDQSSTSLDDLRHLPAMAREANRALEDVQVAQEVEALLHGSDGYDQRLAELLSPETQGRDRDQAMPSGQQALQDQPHQVINVPSVPPVPEIVHDTDPPFLTDGRGRVVWSSTTPGRHRESRRGRSGASAASSGQQKMRREVSDTDVVALRAMEEPLQAGMLRERQGSRPRHTLRAQSSPDGLQGCVMEPGGSEESLQESSAALP